mgnify:FL=1
MFQELWSSQDAKSRNLGIIKLLSKVASFVAYDQWRPIPIQYGFIVEMDIHNILNVQIIIIDAKE